MDQYRSSRSGQNSLNKKLDVRRTLHFTWRDNPAGTIIQVEHGGETFRVQVPKKLQNGHVLCLRGRGDREPMTGHRGDLYLVFEIEEKKPGIDAMLAAASAALILALAIGGWFLLKDRIGFPEQTEETTPQIQQTQSFSEPKETIAPVQTEMGTKPDETQPPLPATEATIPETEPQQVLSETERIMRMAGIVAAGGRHTVIMLPDGTAIAEGERVKGQCDVENWTDLVAVAAGDYYSLGLRSDGTVVTAGDNSKGQCNVSRWKDIVMMIAAGDFHSVGLKSDGTVIIEGNNNQGQLNVGHWRNVVFLTAGDYYNVALTEDGKLLFTGQNSSGQTDFYGWENIIAISAGHAHTVAITAEGEILATGDNQYGQLNIRNYFYD